MMPQINLVCFFSSKKVSSAIAMYASIEIDFLFWREIHTVLHDILFFFCSLIFCFVYILSRAHSNRDCLFPWVLCLPNVEGKHFGVGCFFLCKYRIQPVGSWYSLHLVHLIHFVVPIPAEQKHSFSLQTVMYFKGIQTILVWASSTLNSRWTVEANFLNFFHTVYSITCIKLFRTIVDIFTLYCYVKLLWHTFSNIKEYTLS